jgi:hypothetical protein
MWGGEPWFWEDGGEVGLYITRGIEVSRADLSGGKQAAGKGLFYQKSQVICQAATIPSMDCDGPSRVGSPVLNGVLFSSLSGLCTSVSM